MPQLSLVICTHNRASYLQQALESLTCQSLPREKFEVLVIDNCSTDQTASVTQSYFAKLPLRLIHEPNLGLSVARNRGLVECIGKYVTFLDDDIIACDRLLDEILSGFQSFQPEPVLLGGKVLLNWGGDPPSWLHPHFFTLYSMLDYGEQARLLEGNEYIVGANFSARVTFLRELGGFQSALGRRGNKLLSGEETQVIQAARKAGLPILYQPGALVWHTVTPERKKNSWLRKRLFWDGASQPLLDYGLSQPRMFYMKQSIYDLRRMLRFGVDVCLGRKEAVYPFIQRAGRLRTDLSLLLSSRQREA